MTPAKLVKDGYVEVGDLKYYYPNKSLLSNLDFEYFKVETNEANGVLHIVYKGDYLPYDYLVDNWQNIHLSWDVNIKQIKNTSKSRFNSSLYIVSQYVGSQGSSYVRSSQSWSWVFRGFKRAWDTMKSTLKSNLYYNYVQNKFYRNHREVDFKKELITLWDKYLYNLARIKLQSSCHQAILNLPW